MAFSARAVTRAFARSPATAASSASIRSSAARNASRFALPTQAFRASGRRGYASGPEGEKSSSSALYWGLGAAAIGGAAGAYFYLTGDEGVKKDAAPFVPTKADYQKVYDEIARLLVEKDDYDDGSYGPVRHKSPLPPQPYPEGSEGRL